MTPSSRFPRSGQSSSEDTHPYIAEAGGSSAMAGSHRLHRFTFAAVWSSPQAPMSDIPNRITRFPEVRRDSGIRAVFQQTAALAAFDFVTDLGTELKVQPHVVDAPRA